MSSGSRRTLVALALQTLALVALGLSLLGTPWLDARSKPRVLVLVDRSNSVPRAASAQAVADVVQAAKADGGGDLQLLEFAGRPAAPSPQAATSVGALEPSETNIEAALEAALAAHAEAAFASVVMVSDGLENVGDAARALRAVREARLSLQWIAVGRPPPTTHVREVLAPTRALVGQRIPVTVQLGGRWDAPLLVKATARTPGGDTQTAGGAPDGAGRVTIEFDASRSGAVLVDVVLEDPATGRTLDASSDAALVDVAPRAAILYAQGSSGPLARSLREGGWALNVVSAARLDAHADGLDGYQAVVLDDVAISDASPRFWNALVAAVHNRGLGLMVLGGERSFARGGYRASTLESVLPVLSEPATLDQPAAIMFVVDKSGSMGQGSGGVDRFQLAQRAVLESARGLGERDSLGLMVFDVAPRVLIPLGPAPAGASALERDWPVRPNGGTKLAPALEAAIDELERAAAARRILVLVTDGFVDDAPLAALRARLDRSRIETIALAVGPDADVGALERLLGAKAGTVLRVNQAAELPLVMRSGLERRRARVERGSIAVTQRLALPFAPGTLKDWPAITAHYATRTQVDAWVAVHTQGGEPLIAFRSSGRGRVVAVTCGLGPWTPQWLQWREWPRLAGGLVDWIGGTAQGGAVALAVSDLSGGLQVEADVQTGVGSPDPASVSIAVDTTATQGRPMTLDLVAPGRLRATLPDAGPGLYTFVVSTSLGTQRQLHLRRRRAENEAWGTNPALDTWRSTGLAARWDVDFLARHRDGDRWRRPFDRSLIGLAVALFLAGVVVDRTRPDRAVVKVLRRWSARAR
ncbi:MAG: VWA domain-containing protein [Rubrivivax sp.]|nr:VWA domain-containing protein [Rubrivivax sp.]